MVTKSLTLLAVIGLMFVQPARAAFVDDLVDEAASYIASNPKQFDTPMPVAVQTMNTMLGGAQSLDQVKPARLQTIYTMAAMLLQNRCPISGGVLVQQGAMTTEGKANAITPAYLQFVNTMLLPTDEDDEVLIRYQAVGKTATAKLSALAPNTRMLAQILIYGTLYGDPVAIRIANRKLEHLSAKDAKVLQSAMGVVRDAHLPELYHE